MPRPVMTTLPHASARVENRLPTGVIEEISPIMAARTVCETVRDEHGRKGVGEFLAVAAPFLPSELVAETAQYFHVEPPQAAGVTETKPPQKEAPPIPPELLLSLLQGGGSGGGLDPMMLLKMMQK